MYHYIGFRSPSAVETSNAFHICGPGFESLSDPFLTLFESRPIEPMSKLTLDPRLNSIFFDSGLRPSSFGLKCQLLFLDIISDSTKLKRVPSRMTSCLYARRRKQRHFMGHNLL
jgi:hypothetical protein